MANTTSGTVTFDKTFAVDEIIQDAYERLGVQSSSGYQLKTARRSLNILFQEWGNRGIHYWEVAEANIDLIEGQAEYTFYRASGDGTSSVTNPSSIYGVADVLEATLRSNRTQTMKLLYEDELARALAEDGSAASTYITPKNYYPNI